MIDVTCPHCCEVYHADPVHLGKRIKCTKCSSLLRIVGGGGTPVQKPPEAKGAQPSQPRAEARSAPPSPRRTAFGLGSTVVVAVIAVGVLILWWHSSIRVGTSPVPRTQAGVSQASSQAAGETPESLVNPDGPTARGQEPLGTGSDGPPCDEDEKEPQRSMPNGSRIEPDVGTTGYGVLEVQNGTTEDAVLSLYDSAAAVTVREIYVEARHSVRMKGIPKGTYELAYTAGMDWDGGKATFRCDPDYAQFERDFAFTEERDQEGVQYHTITVTLHPVVGGNIRTKKISREEFLRNYHRTASLPR
jgi:hypothetical protein